MTKVKIILPSIYSGLLLWFVNHTLLYDNSGIKVFKKIELVGEISND